MTLFMLMISNLNAQKYSVDVEIFLQDSILESLIFGRHYGGQTLVVDTLLFHQGSQSYHIKKERLSPGVFFIGTKQNLLFNFIINPSNSHFTIRQVADTFKIDGSAENVAFFAFTKSKTLVENKIEHANQMLEMVTKATKADKDAMRPFQESIDKYYKDIDSLGIHFRKKYPDYWFSKVLKSIELPTLPARIMPQLKNGKPNPEVRQWYRNHYFDHTDFGDSTLLYNPFWPFFFKRYFIAVAHSEPDSLAADIDKVMTGMPPAGPIYRYALRQLIENVEQAVYPGQDRVFVHLIDKYLYSEHTKWLDQATLLRTRRKADVHRGNLTGNIASPLPGLVYADGVTPFHLDSIRSPFTLLIFYSPLCHHCMEVLPGVYETWTKYKRGGLNAVSIATDDQFEYWKGFLLNKDWKWNNVADPSGKLAFKEAYAAYNLPVIYLLDAQRKILWKRIAARDLEAILSRFITLKE